MASSRRTHMIGIGLIVLGLAMLPINYPPQVKTHGNTDEVSYRLGTVRQ